MLDNVSLDFAPLVLLLLLTLLTLLLLLLLLCLLFATCCRHSYSHSRIMGSLRESWEAFANHGAKRERLSNSRPFILQYARSAESHDRLCKHVIAQAVHCTMACRNAWCQQRALENSGINYRYAIIPGYLLPASGIQESITK